jgi:putative ABC transport system ATP-binding protein
MKSPKQPIIRAKGVSKTYNTGGEVYHAIHNLDLDIFEGDFTVIIGNSGSGKSTLLYMLSGLDSVSGGEVYFRGDRIDNYGERALSEFRAKRIGYVYQGINLVPDLTVLDNVSLPGYIGGRRKKDVKADAMRLLESMEIAGQAGRLPAQTSGGQQQRAAIARALINAPDLVFADEPTGSLNVEHGTAVLDILTQINRGGKSVVMVTHDMKAACRADRLIMIRDGRVAETLTFAKYDPSNVQEREAQIFALMSGRGTTHGRKQEQRPLTAVK